MLHPHVHHLYVLEIDSVLIVLIEFEQIPKYAGTIFKMVWFYFYTIFKGTTFLPKMVCSPLFHLSYPLTRWEMLVINLSIGFEKRKYFLSNIRISFRIPKCTNLPANLLGETNCAYNSQSWNNGRPGPNNWVCTYHVMNI